jgi:hypothetical protein
MMPRSAVSTSSTRLPHPDAPILVITAKQVTDEDRRTLNGFVTTIMEKAEFDTDHFTAEVRRAMSGRGLAA